MMILRTALAAALLVAGGGLSAPAMAEPPANDLYDGAVGLQFGVPQTVDTTEATDDDGLPCAYATRGVWYTFTPEQDGGFRIASPDPYANFVLLQGTPTDYSNSWCSSSISADLIGGVEYALVAYSAWWDYPAFTFSVNQIVRPVNDKYEGALPINLPYSGSVPIEDATDDTLGQYSVPRGVWYTYTPAQDEQVVFQFANGCGLSFVSATGEEPNWQNVSPAVTTYPGPGAFATRNLTANTRYTFLMGSWCSSSLLEFTVRAAPFRVDEITVNPVATVDGRGDVAVSGLVRCTVDPIYGPVRSNFNVTLLQRQLGGVKVSSQAYSSSQIICDGSPQPWTVQLSNELRYYKAGKADVQLSGSIYNEAMWFGKEFDPIDAQIRITRR